MVKPGNFEHLRKERDTKIGLKYNKRITMDKMKREKRNVRRCPLSQCLD